MDCLFSILTPDYVTLALLPKSLPRPSAIVDKEDALKAEALPSPPCLITPDYVMRALLAKADKDEDDGTEERFDEVPDYSAIIRAQGRLL